MLDLLQSETVSRMLDGVGLRPPKYYWERSETDYNTAVGWNGDDEVGQIEMATDINVPSRRWLWRVTAVMAPSYRSRTQCEGWAKTSFEAAGLVEIKYDLLMRLNWDGAGAA